MDSTLDRAAVESDSGDDDDNHRILHTTDASSQANHPLIEPVSKRARLKEKAKEILHIDKGRIMVTEPADGVTLAPSPNPSEMPYRLDNHPPEEGIHGLKDFVHQPVQTIKVKAKRKTNKEIAENLSTAEISHAHNVELILAQDHVASAQTEEERSSANQDLEVLKRARQDMFVRWTMDRHVLKIRQLERRPVQHRDRADFVAKGESGQHKMDWKAYGSHVRSIRHAAPPDDMLADQSFRYSSWLFFMLRSMVASTLALLLNHLLPRKKQSVQVLRGS